MSDTPKTQVTSARLSIDEVEEKVITLVKFASDVFENHSMSIIKHPLVNAFENGFEITVEERRDGKYEVRINDLGVDEAENGSRESHCVFIRDQAWIYLFDNLRRYATVTWPNNMPFIFDDQQRLIDGLDYTEKRLRNEYKEFLPKEYLSKGQNEGPCPA